ncbi:long-chain fatty acid--CoA ligase [Solemya pervernicosa gill symbiont]|uniref:Long-chain fatty acid--CoA ligase n=2 Tax=Gammaproteobacteria incertae sedis TaxID=118884 RepID=A0A1T2L3K0_9GAMM|nr:long-chain fatty acid--CoA ligase [Solemya pervernicosa gill symbiont]QKQ28326.1 long-chain fatty acid--CoA ligase [Candidatus Reidiella endopervernicosa]
MLNSSLPELLRSTTTRLANEQAIINGENQISFSEFEQRSNNVAAWLQSQGVSNGERIALYCPNSIEFALAYFGIIKAGATVVPLNLLLNPQELAFILNNADVGRMIYHVAMSDQVSAINEHYSGIEQAVLIGADSEQTINWNNLVDHPEPLSEISFNPADDVAVILYTSGTTGQPKGAMLTHRNLAADTWGVKQFLQLKSGRDRLLVVLPMFHAFAATVGMLTPLLHGLSFIPVPRFEHELIANAIADNGATIFLGVPSMYNVLLRLSDEAAGKLDSLRYCVSGGAAMPVEIMRQFEEKFGKLIYEGDGPTECSPVTCVNPIGGVRKIASVGLPIPGVEMKILDDDGNEPAKGEVGEICVRGPTIMKGYWRLEAETYESFFEDWFRTGDLGTEDEDGYFFIVDRKKDMIIVNGMNVYPRMVEEVLYRYEPIREAAVVGEANELHGEVAVAYVSLNESVGEISSADVRSFCREQLGNHQVPRKVFFLDELPKNAAGKILKRELRNQGELERGIDSRCESD